MTESPFNLSRRCLSSAKNAMIKFIHYLVIALHDAYLTLLSPATLWSLVEILLHEAGELCFILRCFLGLELGHIQEFRNCTPLVSMILVLDLTNRKRLVSVSFGCLQVCAVYFRYCASIKSSSGCVLTILSQSWMWNRFGFDFFYWIHPASSSLESYTCMILVWPFQEILTALLVSRRLARTWYIIPEAWVGSLFSPICRWAPCIAPRTWWSRVIHENPWSTIRRYLW